MFINEDFIVQNAYNLMNGGISVEAIVWCRATYNYNQDVHAQIVINKGDHMKPVLNLVKEHLATGGSLTSIDKKSLKLAASGNGTHAMTFYFDETQGRSMVGIGSNNAADGLLLFSLFASFSIYNDPNKPIDFSKYTISKEGAGGQGINLQ
jgi:hypothetical protein